MYKPRQRRISGNGMVPDLETRCLAGFSGLLSVRRYRAILVIQARWINGGTVIPPCVFQGRNTKNPLNKGSPSDFPHGLRARAGAGVHAHTTKKFKACWNEYYKRFGRCGFLPLGTIELKTQISKKFTSIMVKENLKLLSIRINPETLDAIEKFTKEHPYWTRNSVINNLLTTLFKDFTDKQVYDMARRNFFSKNEIKAEYEITNLMNV